MPEELKNTNPKKVGLVMTYFEEVYKTGKLFSEDKSSESKTRTED